MAMKISPCAVCFQPNVDSTKRGSTLSNDVIVNEIIMYVQMEIIRREELRSVRRRPNRRVDGAAAVAVASVAAGSGSGVGAIDLGMASLIDDFSNEERS